MPRLQKALVAAGYRPPLEKLEKAGMDLKLHPDPLGNTWWRRWGAVVLGVALPIIIALALARCLTP